MSYYDVLGVSRTASAAEIDTAYRRQVFDAHPDGPHPNADRFLQVTEAFYTLSDRRRRAEYDATQQRMPISQEQAARIFDSVLAEWQSWIGSFLRSHEKNGSAWLLTGTAGGAAFGATVAGPVGFVIGGLLGFGAGMTRVTTNKSIYEHWQELSAGDRSRAIEGIIEVFGDVPVRTGAGAAATPSPSPVDVVSEEDLGAMTGSPAGNGEPECKVCLENAVTITNQPCKHACLCAPCYNTLRSSTAPCYNTLRSSTAQCPMCRAPIYQVSRVYF